MSDPTRDAATAPEFPRPLGRGTAPPTMGAYRVTRLLGEGGMGAVYLAHDDTLDRPVAVKMMKPEVAAQPGAVERFLREARAAAKVAHDHVVPILHVGQDAGTPFIVMPLLEGEPLDALLKRDPLPPLGVALKVGRETAAGLAAAHAKGLIHRDVKPANVWVEGDATATRWEERFRRVKILDFGLARPAAPDTHLTSEGAIIGTPSYMSPEQAKGDPVDLRTDLFSLGVLLYRMTTGQQPFRGANAMAVLIELATHNPPAPIELNPAVPPALSDLVTRMLSKKPAERPASAVDAALELRAIGKQLAGRTTSGGARSQSAPVVVVPQPFTVPSPEVNPFTELDGTEVAPPDADESGSPYERASVRRGPGARVWAGVGLALCLAVTGVVAVVKHNGPKRKEMIALPPTSVPAVSDPHPRPLPPPAVQVPRTHPNISAAQWALSVGGRVTIRDAAGAREVVDPNGLPTREFIVTVVSVGGCARVTDAGLENLKGLDGVELLWLDGTGVTDAGLEHLKELKTLTGLSFNDTQIVGTGLAHLTKLDRLVSLSLRNTPLAATGAANFKHLPALQNLFVEGATLTDATLIHFKDFGGLRRLALNGTRITDTGLEHLRGHEELDDLSLTGTDVTDAGLVHLRGLSRLRLLWLDDTGVTDAGLEQLKGLTSLAGVSLRGTRVTGTGLAHLTGLNRLTNLTLIGAPVSSAGLTTLKNLPALQRLWLDGTNVTDDDIKPLAACTKLVQVQLEGTSVTDDGLRHLGGLPELALLHLVGTRITDVGLEHLHATTTLTVVALHRTRVTSAGVQKLQKALPRCRINFDPPKK